MAIPIFPTQPLSDGLMLLKAKITRLYGERCEAYEPGCACCDAWNTYDRLVELLDDSDW